MVCRTLFNVKKLIDYGNLFTFNKWNGFNWNCLLFLHENIGSNLYGTSGNV